MGGTDTDDITEMSGSSSENSSPTSSQTTKLAKLLAECGKFSSNYVPLSTVNSELGLELELDSDSDSEECTTDAQYNNSVLMSIVLERIHTDPNINHLGSRPYSTDTSPSGFPQILIGHHFKRKNHTNFIYLSVIAANGPDRTTAPQISNVAPIIKNIITENSDTDIIFNYRENNSSARNYFVTVHIKNNFHSKTTDISFIDSRSYKKEILKQHINSIHDLSDAFIKADIIKYGMQIVPKFLDMQADDMTLCGPTQSRITLLLARDQNSSFNFRMEDGYRLKDNNRYWNYKEMSRNHEGYHVCFNKREFRHFTDMNQNVLYLTYNESNPSFIYKISNSNNSTATGKISEADIGENEFLYLVSNHVIFDWTNFDMFIVNDKIITTKLFDHIKSEHALLFDNKMQCAF